MKRKQLSNITSAYGSGASCIILASLVSVTLLSGVVLSSSFVSADDVVDEVSITVPTSCTMSGTSTSSHTAEIANGQSNSAVGESTIKAFCNDNNGFAVYAIGYTNDTLGNNTLTDGTQTIATGTGTTGNSQWAMKLTPVSSPTSTYPIIVAGSSADTLKEQDDPDFTSFQQVPDDYARVAYRTAGTDTGTSAEGSAFKTTYQVYISSTQPAGTYEGKVKYVLVNPYSGEAPTIPIVGPTGCVTPVPNLIYMQDLNSSNRSAVLASMTEDAQYFLKDARDDKEYCVSKLKDGNIWMTQNLDFDIGSTTLTHNTTTLMSDDTDIPANWTPNSTIYYDSMDWFGSTTAPELYDPGDLYWNGTIVNNYASQTSSTGDSHYHLGNYYNWTAAVAMNNSSSYNVDTYDYETGDFTDQEVNQSICPAGWMLPKSGSSNGSFEYLLTQYGWSSQTLQLAGDNKVYNAPLYLFFNGNVWHSVGYDGAFWISDSIGAFSDGYFGARFLNLLNDGRSYPNGYSDNGNGWGVRCVMRSS